MTGIVELAIPLMAPLSWESENSKFLYAACLDELRCLPALPASEPRFKGTLFRIQILDTPEDEPLLREKWEPCSGVRSYALLKLTIDATACLESIQCESERSAGKFTKEEVTTLCQQLTISFVEYELNLFLLTTNLAKPGAISAIEGYSFFDGKFLSNTAPFFSENIMLAIETSVEIGWPKLLTVTIVECWKWMVDSKQVVDGIGIGSAGRTLSAISHLTMPSLSTTSSVGLFWAMIGLEALYVRGNHGVKKQLRSKTEIILGVSTENENFVKNVYDFRSRLIHGDVDIPLRFSPFDGAQNFEKYHETLYRNEVIALAALIGTLQWMIKNKRFELNIP